MMIMMMMEMNEIQDGDDGCDDDVQMRDDALKMESRVNGIYGNDGMYTHVHQVIV